MLYARSGKKVQLTGAGFLGVNRITVGGKNAVFAIAQDANIVLIVPETAKNRTLDIVLTNAGEQRGAPCDLVKKG